MPRPQFSIRTQLWLTLVAAAFSEGMILQRGIYERHTLYYKVEAEPDGTFLAGMIWLAPFLPPIVKRRR